MRVRGAALGALRFVDLGQLTAIYDARSGQTHVVAAPVPAILGVIEGETDLSAILAALGVADDSDARARLAERLEELIAAGLAEAI